MDGPGAGRPRLTSDWLIAQIEPVAAADGPVHLVGHDWGCLLAGGIPPAVAAAITWEHDRNRAITLSLYRSATYAGQEWPHDLRKIVVPSTALRGQCDLIVPIE